MTDVNYKSRFESPLKTKSSQFDNFVVTGGTVSCHYDNLRCHQWKQSRQIDDRFGASCGVSIVICE